MADRRDSKNRKLFIGESQDKDGRYTYRYVDALGKRRTVYSWRLTEADPTPIGKRKEMSLREKEKQIQKDLYDGIISYGGDLTVLELVEKYVAQKRGVRHNTKANYKFIINVLAKEPFGTRRIDKVKLSDAKAFMIKMQDDGRGYSTIHAMRGIIKPAFQMAVNDDLIRKNPFDFTLTTVVENTSVTREALTQKHQKEFLNFIKNDKHFSRYYDGIFILLNTGLRISEFVGLTISDVDLKSRKIRVDHQLQRTRDMKYVILETKTASGIREIPMNDEVYACFKRIIENRKAPKVEPMIGGKAGFLFLDKNGMPMVALHWEKYFQRIREKYNASHKVKLPAITPHVCRHTFCSNMAKNGMNPKALQYIMGHSDISVTMNVYTHFKYEDAKKELLRVANS